MAEKSRIFPVVLSGGSGTRLWPLSRTLYPKQFLSLVSKKTMLQETVERVADPALFHPPLVVCNEEHRFLVAEQLREIGVAPHDIVLEPVARNTAPAIAAAALLLSTIDPQAVMLVLPSDHVISKPVDFHKAVKTGLAAARAGSIVTFGIKPSSPEPSYGYIAKGAPLDGAEGCFRVEKFIEKPDRATAAALSSGSDIYYWNAGIFLVGAADYIAELERLDPSTVKACRDAVMRASRDLDFCRLDADAFARARNDSIDYAVMQHTHAAAVVPAEIGWSDIGSWSALWRIGNQDHSGNVTVGEALIEDTTGCYVRSEGPLVVAIGLSDLIVVATVDAVLVVPKDRAADVQLATARLAAENRREHMFHRKVHRPWGSYEEVDVGDRFKVKRLVVRPGGKLSLQTHEHRAEHWVVVRGTARVTRDDKTFLLSENQSTYIPPRVQHRLENAGTDPLYLVEVQSGDYLGEDDIVRLDDAYGRA
jgi:mannose-1-phosphate guanylyltransferase/mannose-6-phosphate isomerase